PGAARRQGTPADLAHARRGLPRQSQGRAAHLPRPRAGAGRSRNPDEGLRNVRVRSQVLPLASGGGAGISRFRKFDRTLYRRPRALRRRGRARLRRFRARSARRPAGDGSSLRRLRQLRSLPPRLVAALPRGITVYGVTAHGGHADYLKVPLRTLVSLPEELSFAEGAAVACGTGTAYAALRRMRIVGGDTLAVFGQGPVGLSATLLASTMGA